MKINPYKISIVLLIFILTLLSLIFLIFNISNPLFFLIIPSIIFEQLFEKCCFQFSNNYFANLIFTLLFWLIIILSLGFFLTRLKSYYNPKLMKELLEAQKEETIKIKDWNKHFNLN